MARNFTHFFPSAGTNANVDQQEDKMDDDGMSLEESGVELTKSGNDITVTGATFDSNAYAVGEHVVFPQSTGVSISGVVFTYASMELVVRLDVPTTDAEFESGAGKTIIPITAGSVSFTGDFDAPGDVNLSTGDRSEITIGNTGSGAKITLLGVGGPLDTTEVLALTPDNNIVRTSKTSFGVNAGEVATWAEGDDTSKIPASKVPEISIVASVVFEPDSSYTFTTEAEAITDFITDWNADTDVSFVIGGEELTEGVLIILNVAPNNIPLVYTGSTVSPGDDITAADLHDITHAGQVVETIMGSNGVTVMGDSNPTISLDPTIFTVASAVEGVSYTTNIDGSTAYSPGDVQYQDTLGGATDTNSILFKVLTGFDDTNLVGIIPGVSTVTISSDFTDGFGSTGLQAVAGQTFTVVLVDAEEGEFTIATPTGVTASSSDEVATGGFTVQTAASPGGATVDGNVTADAFIGNADTATALSAATLDAADDTHFYRGDGMFGAVPAGVSITTKNTIPVANALGDAATGTDYVDSLVSQTIETSISNDYTDWDIYATGSGVFITGIDGYGSDNVMLSIGDTVTFVEQTLTGTPAGTYAVTSISGEGSAFAGYLLGSATHTGTPDPGQGAGTLTVTQTSGVDNVTVAGGLTVTGDFNQTENLSANAIPVWDGDTLEDSSIDVVVTPDEFDANLTLNYTSLADGSNFGTIPSGEFGWISTGGVQTGFNYASTTGFGQSVINLVFTVQDETTTPAAILGIPVDDLVPGYVDTALPATITATITHSDGATVTVDFTGYRFVASPPTSRVHLYNTSFTTQIPSTAITLPSGGVSTTSGESTFVHGAVPGFTTTTVTDRLTVTGETTLNIDNQGTGTDYQFQVIANSGDTFTGADGFITFELE